MNNVVINAVKYREGWLDTDTTVLHFNRCGKDGREDNDWDDILECGKNKGGHSSEEEEDDVEDDRIVEDDRFSFLVVEDEDGTTTALLIVAFA